MNVMDFIKPELLILVPALYFIGIALKKSEGVADRHIPLWLGLCGVLLAVLWVMATSDIGTYKDALMAVFVAITQGVLAAGCSVYANQIVKQHGKADKDDENLD